MAGLRQQQSGMAPPALRIVFNTAERHGGRSAAIGLFGGLVDALLSNGAGGTISGGGTPVGTIRRYPEVAVYNAAGRRHVLDVVDTDQEAEQRAAVMAEDLETLGTAAWCQRYHVPLSFVAEGGSAADETPQSG
jgi:hypothetical protein